MDGVIYKRGHIGEWGNKKDIRVNVSDFQAAAPESVQVNRIYRGAIIQQQMYFFREYGMDVEQWESRYIRINLNCSRNSS